MPTDDVRVNSMMHRSRAHQHTLMPQQRLNPQPTTPTPSPTCFSSIVTLKSVTTTFLVTPVLPLYLQQQFQTNTTPNPM